MSTGYRGAVDVSSRSVRRWSELGYWEIGRSGVLGWRVIGRRSVGDGAESGYGGGRGAGRVRGGGRGQGEEVERSGGIGEVRWIGR